MAHISNLPIEIMEIIFAYLIAISIPWDDRRHRQFFQRFQVGRWRLVCRGWATWFYENQLYRKLSFTEASRTLGFIDFLRERPRTLPRAKCQHLVVDGLGIIENPFNSDPRDAINWNVLDILLGLLHDTVTTLELRFVDEFTLPSQSIKAIGRIKGLQTLRLARSCKVFYTEDLTCATYHPGCFSSLLIEAQGLKSLRLALPVFPPGQPHLITGAPYPAITQLDIDLSSLSPEDILCISIALKPSLKLLNLRAPNPAPDPRALVPIFETLGETIEGISVTAPYCLEPLYNLRFPKLRFVAVHDMEFRSFVSFLTTSVFSQAPAIEIIALDFYMAQDESVELTEETFSNWSRLRKVFFWENQNGKATAAPHHRAACRAHHIECIPVDHDEESPLMGL